MKVTTLGLIAFTGLAGVVHAATTTYQGPDGGDLTDAANWNGNPPQYDETTNPETKLVFTKSPAANYGTTLSQNLTAYSASLASGLDLDVDLNKKTLQFVSDFEFDALSSLASHNLLPGGDVIFSNGTLKLLSADGLTRKKFSFLNSVATARIGRNSSVTLDGVTGEGNFYSTATNTVVVLTNGTKWVGSYTTYDGAKYSRFVVAGPGTICDFDNTTIVLTGRGNLNSSSNTFVLADGAVATNVGYITSGGVGGRVEFLDDSRVYFLSGASWNPGLATVRFVNGQHHVFTTIQHAKQESDLLFEVGGKGTIVETTGQISSTDKNAFRMSDSKDTHRNRLWVHDGAVLDVTSGEITVGNSTASTSHDQKVEVTDGGTLNSGWMQIGTGGGLRNTVRVDTASQMGVTRFALGASSSTTQTNLLWVGDQSTLTASDWVKLFGGEGSRIVISNGTFSVSSGIENVSAGYEVTFAGLNPRVSCEYINYGGPVKVVFQVPEAGYVPDVPLFRTTQQRNRSVSANITPVFEMRDFARKTGGTITIAEGYNLSMSDEVLAVWQAAAEAGCDGCAKVKFSYAQTSGRNTRLLLTVKPKKGLAILIR